MGLAILGIVVVLYLVLAYLAAKSWQTWHVVVVFFLFLGTLFMCLLTAATLNMQKAHRSRYEQFTKDIETEKVKQRELVEGSPSTGEPGELQLRGELARLLAVRGRVWRNIRVAALDNEKGLVVLDPTGWSDTGCRPVGDGEGAAEDTAVADGSEEAAAAPAEGAAEGAPAPAPVAADPAGVPGLDVDTVIFAFKEAPLSTLPAPLQNAALAKDAADEQLSTGGISTEDSAEAEATDTAASTEAAVDEAEGQSGEEGAGEAGVGVNSCPVPLFFMGEFRIVANAAGPAGSLSLSPLMPLTESQIQQLQDPQATWAIYEVMPTDDHSTLRGLKPNQLRQLLPPEGLSENAYEAMMQEYTRDLTTAADQDPPERKWLEVKFKQAETVDVDVEVAAEGAEPSAEGAFDPSGRNLDPRLRVKVSESGEPLDKPTAFEEGAQAVLDAATAQDLIGQAKVELVKPIYHRRLRDYARAFRELARSSDSVSREIDMAQIDLQKLQETRETQQRKLAFDAERQSKLQADRDGLNNERQILEEFRNGLEGHMQALRGELSRLYRTNRQLVSDRSR